MKKILIVEDNEMNMDMLCRRLVRKGFIIDTATNGEEAITMANRCSPDLILMDMSLPVMDGWEATRHLKSQDVTSNIPIIGLSAHARDVDIIRGLEAGCDAYETKPVDLSHLLETMDSLFAQA